MKSKITSGSVLVIILIAVALFAALSYAVTSSSRSGGGTIDAERSQLVIDSMMQYGVALRTGITRLLVGSACTENTISFAYSGWSNPWLYTNLATPASAICELFSPKGGGVVWQKTPKGTLDTGATEYIISGSLGIVGIGTPAIDLILLARVSKALCLRINMKLKIPNPAGDPPKKSIHALGPPPANFMAFGYGSENGLDNYFSNAGSIGDDPTWADLKGKPEGCFEDDARDLYYFYEVLLER